MQEQGRLPGFPPEESDKSSDLPHWGGKITVFGRIVCDGFKTDARNRVEAARNFRNQYAKNHNGKYPPKGDYTIEVWERKSALANR